MLIDLPDFCITKLGRDRACCPHLLHTMFSRDEEIMARWKQLLDKLEGRKTTLAGYNSLMGMFREIESIQEELREVQVHLHYISWKLLNLSNVWF